MHYALKDGVRLASLGLESGKLSIANNSYIQNILRNPMAANVFNKIYDDIYKEIKDIKSVLVNTNKGFFPLEKYTLYDEHVVTYKNNDGKLLYN